MKREAGDAGDGFRVAFSDRPGYLRAHVFGGTDSLQVSLAVWKRLGEECAARAATRLLVLEELHGSVGAAEMESVIDSIPSAGLANVRIAFVEVLDDLQGSEYGQILCQERGLRVRAFAYEDEARRWLLYGD